MTQQAQVAAGIDLASAPEETTPAAKGWQRYKPSTFYAFVTPWVLGFLGLTVFPLAFALWMSFTNYDGISATSGVGLDNYSRALQDSGLHHALLVTLLLMAITVPGGIILGLVLAMLLNLELGRARPLYRALLYLPSVLPVTAGALAFRMVFDQDVGPVNSLLIEAGFDAVTWFEGGPSFWILLAFMFWGVGGNMIISLAALQSVPREVTEAATVDGASSWRRFWSITVPILSPILLFQFVTGVISALQMFVPAMLMGNSNMAGLDPTGVPEGLQVYMLHVYMTYFSFGEFGYASAMLWLLFIVIVLFTGLVFWITRGRIFYASEIQEG